MEGQGRISLLGGLRVVQSDRCITRFVTRKFADLLAYLAFYRDRAHLRDELVALLWPESEPAAGRRHLRVALTSLRHQLGPLDAIPWSAAPFLGTRDTIQLNPAIWTTDVALFVAACRQAERACDSDSETRHLATAVELYTGELLPGGCDCWVIAERQRLAEQFLQAATRLGALREKAGDLSGALQWARRAVAADPLREEARHELVRLLVAAGESAAALRECREAEQLFQTELGIMPSSGLRALLSQSGPGAAAHRGSSMRTTRTGSTLGERSSAGLGAEHALIRKDHSTPQNGTTPPTEAPAREITFSLSPCLTDARSEPEGNLPVSTTRFFGREVEIADLCALLATPPALSEAPVATAGPEERETAAGTRLVTLTGPGGIGKTRLALAVAGRLRAALCEGRPGRVAWFVPLAELTPASPAEGGTAGACRRIELQIQAALRLPPSPETGPLDQIVAFLSRRPVLLLLDNTEHMIEAGARLVQTLLERVPGLTVLVTSRRRLNLATEREFPLAPLPVPVESGKLRVESPAKTDRTDPTDLSTLNSQLSTLTQCASVRLFLDRAQSVRPDFQLTPRNGEAIARLCARLEGIPLALELAAARVWVLSPAQMLERLECALPSGGRSAEPARGGEATHGSGRFELLAGQRRDSSSRHRSLRAALEWSYQLLAPELQRFFCSLSVFRGGWTLEAAEAVCGPALDALDQLREASLILAEMAPAGASVRYRMLETLREYAAERFEPEQRAAAQFRHAFYYSRLAEQDEDDARGEKQRERTARLESEQNNFRAALEWCTTPGVQAFERSGIRTEIPRPAYALNARTPDRLTPIEIGFRLARLLLGFWNIRGCFSEGRQWLTALLAHPGAAALPEARACALADAGHLAFVHGDPAAARPLLEESLALFRELGEQGGMALALNHLASFAPDLDAQAALYEESLALFREVGNQDRIANSLFNQAFVALTKGDFARARLLAGESRAIYEGMGNGAGTALVSSVQAELALEEGCRGDACRFVEEALAGFREFGNKQRLRLCLGTAAKIARLQGDLEAARSHLLEALGLARGMEHEAEIARLLKDLGKLEQKSGDEPAARTLLAEAPEIDYRTRSDLEVAACRDLPRSADEPA